MTITPEQARSFAEEATLKVETLTHIEKDQVFYSLVTDDDRLVATDLDKGDAELLAIAPDLAQTIAGMRWEWACEWDDVNGAEHGPWHALRREAEIDVQDMAGRGAIARLVRRLVGPVEVME